MELYRVMIWNLSIDSLSNDIFEIEKGCKLTKNDFFSFLSIKDDFFIRVYKPSGIVDLKINFKKHFKKELLVFYKAKFFLIDGKILESNNNMRERGWIEKLNLEESKQIKRSFILNNILSE